MDMAKRQYTNTEELLAIIADRLGWLIWAKTKDGQRGRNKPKSIYEEMTKKKEKETSSLTIEELEEKFRQRRENNGKQT